MNMLDFYNDQVHPLHDFYREMEKIGIMIDEEERKKQLEACQVKIDSLQIEIDKLLQEEGIVLEGSFNVNSNSKQVPLILYSSRDKGGLGIPPRQDCGEETLQAIINNEKKIKDKPIVIRILTITLELRKTLKNRNTYLRARVSEDNRMHTQVLITGTETFRTSNKMLKPPVSIEKEGLAFQTLTKHGDIGGDLRKYFIADPGYVFVELDFSQSQARHVAVLCRNYQLLKDFDNKEFVQVGKNLVKIDCHRRLAGVVYNKQPQFINDDPERQVGKFARHGANFDMGKHEFMIQLAGHNVFISEWRCGKILEDVHRAEPSIREIFHAEIQQALQDNDLVLTTPQGRKRRFFNKWGRDLWKEAYAYIPQATESDQTKFTGVRIKRRLPFVKFLSESHDSLLAMIPNNDRAIYHYTKVAKEEAETPINYRHCSLSRDFDLAVPCEFVIGKNWKEFDEEKNPEGMRKLKI